MVSKYAVIESCIKKNLCHSPKGLAEHQWQPQTSPLGIGFPAVIALSSTSSPARTTRPSDKAASNLTSAGSGTNQTIKKCIAWLFQARRYF